MRAAVLLAFRRIDWILRAPDVSRRQTMNLSMHDQATRMEAVNETMAVVHMTIDAMAP
jgi:hypothetical protein